jgi:hypothetical protein
VSRAKDEPEVIQRVVDRSTGTANVLIRQTGETPSSDPPASGAERRTSRRFDLSMSVTLFGDHNFYLGTQNILPIGSKLRLEFTLPTSAVPLSIMGEVRWVRSSNASHAEYQNFGSSDEGGSKGGMGVQFTDVSPDAMRAINRFMKHRKPDFFEE